MKILVNVHVPAVGMKYDILVPESLRIKSVTTLIAETVETLSGHRYVSSGEECLSSVEMNILLRNNATLKQYGIKNGDHLIMM
ncbi:MAG: hypothetical protein E7455_07010 [Ruminococcaceae bacterium]|nr:hypothetical protein [Oscillospiraceae bacterium]